MLAVCFESTIIDMSEIFLISPPLFPKNEIVFAPFFFDISKPFVTFFEFPLVEIPITMSPELTKLSPSKHGKDLDLLDNEPDSLEEALTGE